MKRTRSTLIALLVVAATLVGYFAAFAAVEHLAGLHYANLFVRRGAEIAILVFAVAWAAVWLRHKYQ